LFGNTCKFVVAVQILLALRRHFFLKDLPHTSMKIVIKILYRYTPSVNKESVEVTSVTVRMSVILTNRVEIKIKIKINNTETLDDR
jgi:hypothetical protein